ncbi:IclR family transcriptional regulator [Enterococcus malodoratus]|uniref:IclR family transcriptional regulator n=1 Tax=Enterococcus malodoratus ATCC 43197 TaxID=1158601 RepID=R2R823_9ENTE|nr:IclR family transcriptional regulator [Enterococcus malodoratus]EOH72109.1 hypothetical protein UAI_04393 [Enterococcus malodoratus ATCC 43197]EOT69867.1 hypothetical protein I585_01346 [Enterococcus malodoratus ATCC 43197]OJG56439.1 hypothetical protein RV07_GL004131 [Enterococcus malodoratus]STC70781.1 IclR transcriptional regulator [Enterococcus malodoratus]
MHRSTYRVLKILELLANSLEGLSLTNLSNKLDIPKGSLHPILKTMLSENFIRLDENDNYKIGQQAYHVGFSYTQDSDLLHEIDLVIKELSSTVNQTVYFSVLSSGDTLYLLKQSVPTPIQIIAKQGFTFPAYSTAIGKSLLSDYSMEELKRLYPDGFIKLSEYTIDNFEELYKQLKQVRETGFSYEKEESNKDVQCVAIPIKYNNKVIAAISIATPIFYYNDQFEDKAKEALLKAKSKIEFLISEDLDGWTYSALV